MVGTTRRQFGGGGGGGSAGLGEDEALSAQREKKTAMECVASFFSIYFFRFFFKYMVKLNGFRV